MGSIKSGEIFDQLSNYQLLNKDSVPRYVSGVSRESTCKFRKLSIQAVVFDLFWLFLV